MSKRAFEPKPGQAPMTKPEKRDAARLAKAAAAAAERRRKITMNALVGLAVLLVIGAIAFWLRSPSGITPTAQSSSAPAELDPALKVKPAVAAPTGTVSALKVTTVIEGKGEPTVAGKQITVNYVGMSFNDGKEFDSSWKTGGQPFSLVLGQGNVIKGWDEGLVGVKVGSRVQIDIPSDKAYGENPAAGYPAGALRFVVDVLSMSDPNT